MTFAVDHAAGMGVVQGAGELAEQVGHHADRHALVVIVQGFKVGCQGGTRDVFHHQVGTLVDDIVGEHADDVRMPHPLDHFGFALEAGQLLGVLVEHSPHHFDGNFPVRAPCAGVYLGHASTSDQTVDMNVSENLAFPVWHAENYNRQ